MLRGMALHLDIPTDEQLTALLGAREPGSVSAYLPTSPLPQDADAARIELKNLAAEAERQLGDAGRGVRSSSTTCSPTTRSGHQLANSLAVFATADSLRTFRLPNRLVSMVEVSDRFHLKPLLRSVTFPQAALVLALAQGSVRLIEVAARRCRPSRSHVADLPSSAAEEGRARCCAGHLGDEGQKVRMRQYARQVDTALRTGPRGPRTAADPGRRGATGLDLPLRQQLPAARRAWHRRQSRGRVRRRAGGGRARDPGRGLRGAARRRPQHVRGAPNAGRGATDVTDVARAATFGAVDTLMVDIDDVIPGFVAATDGTVTFNRRGRRGQLRRGRRDRPPRAALAAAACSRCAATTSPSTARSQRSCATRW